MSGIPGIILDPSRIQTNIVIFEVEDGDAPGLLRRLEERGVRGSNPHGSRARMVTHHGITEEDIEAALEVVELLMRERSGAHRR